MKPKAKGVYKFTLKDEIYTVIKGAFIGRGRTKGRALVNLLNLIKAAHLKEAQAVVKAERGKRPKKFKSQEKEYVEETE